MREGRCQRRDDDLNLGSVYLYSFFCLQYCNHREYVG